MQARYPTKPLRPAEPLSVVIPVKAPELAKSRLDLPGHERAELAAAMMRHVVSTALAAPTVDEVVVVSADTAVGTAAEQLGASWVLESEPNGLNAAIGVGVQHVRSRRHGDVLVMVSDLPGLTTEDLELLIDEFRSGGKPVVVTDHLGTGTTLLALGPHDDLPFLFGPDSATRHQDAGYLPAIGALLSLRHDLDTPTDLSEFAEVGRAVR